MISAVILFRAADICCDSSAEMDSCCDPVQSNVFLMIRARMFVTSRVFYLGFCFHVRRDLSGN
jgi:hypothetical protein